MPKQLAGVSNNKSFIPDSTIYLTGLDKIAIAAEALGEDDRELEKQICDYAAAIKQSPLMISFLRRKADLIARETSEEGRDLAMTLLIAELRFAEKTSVQSA